MSARELFLSFEGRISRAPYWTGLIILIVAQYALILAYLYALGVPLSAIADPQYDRVLAEANVTVTLILAYPGLALMCKRLHDRNRSGWWGVLLYGLSIAGEGVTLAGYAGPADSPSLAELAILIPLALIGLWFLIELGFLRGTVGPNRFGPDPLGGVAPAGTAQGAGGQAPLHGGGAHRETVAARAAAAPQPAARPAPAGMDWRGLFFSFRGRISRKSFWIGMIVISVLGSLASFIVLAILGTAFEDPETAGPLALAPLALVALAMMVTSLAVSVKRLHDRNKSGWWMAMYYIVLAVQTAAVSSGMMAPPGRPEALSIALALFNFAIVIYYIVELGILKGTPGPNSYGPDPLGDSDGPYAQGDASF